MGRRGPLEETPATLSLKGSWRAKTRAKQAQPRPRPGANCPAILRGPARAEWHRVAPELRRLGLLTVLDRALLATYCQTWARWLEANELVEREGLTVARLKGAKPHPALTVAGECARLLVVLAREFGLSPTSRQRLRVGVEPPKPTDDLESFASHRTPPEDSA